MRGLRPSGRGITPNLSTKLEYIWVGAGSLNTLKANLFRVGLNWLVRRLIEIRSRYVKRPSSLHEDNISPKCAFELEAAATSILLRLTF